MPRHHGAGDLPKVLDRSIQGHSAFGRDHVHARLQDPLDLRADPSRAARQERDGVIDVADERHPPAHGRDRLLWSVPRIEMERCDASLGDVRHPVEGSAAYVQDERRRQPLDQLRMDVLEIPPVVLRGHQIACGVVGDSHRIRAGLDLGQTERYGHLLETCEAAGCLCRIVDRHEQEGLQSECAVTERPWPHDLAEDGDVVAESTAQGPDRVEHAANV